MLDFDTRCGIIVKLKEMGHNILCERRAFWTRYCGKTPLYRVLAVIDK